MLCEIPQSTDRTMGEQERKSIKIKQTMRKAHLHPNDETIFRQTSTMRAIEDFDCVNRLIHWNKKVSISCTRTVCGCWSSHVRIEYKIAYSIWVSLYIIYLYRLWSHRIFAGMRRHELTNIVWFVFFGCFFGPGCTCTRSFSHSTSILHAWLTLNYTNDFVQQWV